MGHLDFTPSPSERPPNDPQTSALVPVNSRIVTWEDGVPVVRTLPVLTRAQVSEIAMAAASMPYEEPGDRLALELGLPVSQYFGRPCVEVMLIKRAQAAALTGDKDEVEQVLDRILGKPKTSAENVSVSKSYEQYLEEIDHKEALPAKRLD